MSKYKAKKTIVDGIAFDSITESEYYLHLKVMQKRGEIVAFALQPKFELQEAFEKDGKKYRKIEYIADFEVIHHDGNIEIVDVKGMITPDFKLKQKMFEKKYPYKLSLMKYVKKFGGWIEYSDWKKLKQQEKLTKKQRLRKG
jgi:hypothetical protein